MMLVNGASDRCIPVADRGFQYGDGLFETLEIQDGQPVFWRRHMRRLEAGCRRLGIPAPDPRLLATEARSLCKDAPRAVLKIIVTRGSGGRGYRQPDHIETTRVLSMHPFPDYPPELSQNGIVARFCSTRLGLNPALAGLKHLNRLEQVLARAEWQDPKIHEGLMLDNDGHIVEGTMSNLFTVKDSILYTDPLRRCGIAGIVREVVLEICAKRSVQLVEAPLTQAQVLNADAVFVTNSVIGIWPVRGIEDCRFETGGPVLRQVMTWFGEVKRREYADAH